MFSRKLLTVLGSLSLLSASALWAARPEAGKVGAKIFSIGPRGTYFDPKDSDEGRWFVGAQARLRLLSAFAVEGSVDYRKHDYNNGATTVKQYPVQASALFYLLPDHRISPFLLGGAGWYYTHVDGPGGYSNTQHLFGLHAGGGLELMLNEHLSVDASYRYIWMEKLQSRDRSATDKEYEDSGSMATLGLNIHF